ncbi:MAG: hypothetical protein NVS9B2_27920 [Steroidobacteraceae bacterium]
MDGRNYQAYRDYALSLKAGVPQDVRVRGTYWQVIAATQAITMTFDETSAISRGQGTGGPANYSRVTLLSAVDQNVVIALGDANGLTPYDSRSAFGGTINVTPAPPAVGANAPDVVVGAGAQALLIGLDATRRAVIFTVPADATGPIRIGDSTTGIASGSRVYPGASATIEGTQALYAYNAGSAPVAVSVYKQS